MRYTIIVFIFLSTALTSWGQLRQLPIQYPVSSVSTNPAARLQELTPITLPFWDDFSTSTGLLDTTWWIPGSQVQILPRPGNGILPPTINVVTFDGVDANGIPYSQASTDGLVDSLVSQPIDLSQVPTSLRGTVFLSFFFQVKGLGNQPEPEDSLHLYFKKADGSWQKMWPLAGDNVPQDPTIFTEKLVMVPNSADYFYDSFQFKFQAIGRQNGWFDNWNIDYVYMDKRRNPNDKSYLDRAFTDLPTSILNGYSAMPFNEFTALSDPTPFLLSSSTWIRNLENDTQPVKYTAIITDTLNNIVLDTIASSVGLLLFPGDVKKVVSSLPDPGVFDLNADSLFLEIKYSVSSGDKNLIDSIYNAGADTAFYANINLRVNDTVRSYVAINDYFAYDDGSAEFGAGINQKDGRIAYQFVTQNIQFVDRVEFYFPNISRNQAGSPIEIYVLKELGDINNPFLGFTTGSIRHDGINEFVSYQFNTSILVQDTFYIGFRNLADDGLWTAIGLDKNTDTGDKIYYSISGTWSKNTSIQGSLMIRPHFVDELVTGIEIEKKELKVYPNPTTDMLYVEGDYDKIDVFDLAGRPVNYDLQDHGYRKQLLFATRNKGLIFIVIEIDGEKIVRKVLLTY
jgi:Secretion system C-terminal sorting domain